MAHLSWASKKPAQPIPSVLKTDSIVYPAGEGYPRMHPSSRLILGDNLATMSALLPEFEGRIHLIYADPPFFSRRQYPARVGRGEDSRRPQEWQLAEGYPDEWTDLDQYLDMLYPRLVLTHRLLADNGTFYLHLDWHADAYARLLLDEIFGPDRLLNEIVWVYHGPSPIRSAFNRKHDTILAYTKSDEYTFNVEDVRQPYNSNTIKTFASSPKAGFGKVPDLERGKVPEDWWYFPVVARLHRERTGYPTQKPEALLERILMASSNPGDLVADFFAGSGTAAVIAARYGRRFIANDIADRAVQTTRSRLVSSRNAPFILQYAETQGDPHPALPPAQVLDPSLVSLRRMDTGLQVVLADELVFDLEYWEVDPDWDGVVFRSAGQVTRPRKQSTILSQVQIPDLPGRRGILVRLFYISGKRAQVLLNI